MRRLTCIQLLLFFFAAAAARGAQPPTAAAEPEGLGRSVAAPPRVATEASDDVTEPVIPKREITFEISQEPVSVLLTVPDSKLLEQRYVAEFVIDTRLPIGDWSGGPVGKPDAESRQVRSLVYAFGGYFSRRKSYGDYLSHVPEDQRPSKELIDALVPPFLRVESTGRRADLGGMVDIASYRVFAPTSDRAKELVQTLLRVYDYGLAYPVQRKYLLERRAAAKKLDQYRDELDKLMMVKADYGKQLDGLASYEDINDQALVTYRAQQRMLDVDTAGIKARIDACNKILERKEIPAARVEQVETVKITAEIELVGLDARQSAIGKIIQNGEKRVQLLRKLRENEGSAEDLRRLNIGPWEKQIALYTAERKAWEQCPIDQGKVIIRPVKWETASADKHGSGPDAGR